MRDGGCQARRKDNERCKAVVTLSSGYCAMHDPARQADVAAARVRGGRHSATSVRLSRLMPARLVPVYAQLEQALADVLADRLDPKNATAAAAISRAMVAVLTAGEVEERLRKLEERQ